jgi:16S rRNA (uracil1498-N3)-methyltransferase
MTVHRFFVAPEDAPPIDRFPLPESIAHQVRRVLRLRDGAPLVLLTGDGNQVSCRLDGDACVVESRAPAGGEPVHRLTIIQALLKGNGLETVVQQGTEVGVSAFRLVVTERCVVRELSPRRMERLRAIARESAEQSERGRVPTIHDPQPFADVLSAGGALLSERSRGLGLGAITPPSALLIGPEGGFSPSELEAADTAGMTLASLGPRILRAETVAATAAAVVLSRAGDFA